MSTTKPPAKRPRAASQNRIRQWFAAAREIMPAWRARQHLRQTCTPSILAGIERHSSVDLQLYVRRLWEDEYFRFEPRPSQPDDDQEGFVDSQSLISIALGGNGSGKTYCGAIKCIQFLETTPPPAADTPFWVIANSYEQVMSTCWHQKLRTMLPAEWIEERRITWYSEKRNWPKAVPLKPWPGRPGKNWIIEFKSYEQGREEMQAAALGGAWFTEQFPYEIFLEVLRGIREYAFPGSVWAEFTPIDPAKSVAMEEAYDRWIENDPDYKAWSFHSLNTQAALEAGHVDADWFAAFYASISEEMRETRMRGVFASYEGAIYKSFRPQIHLTEIDPIFPTGVIHKRSADWGAGEENAFVVLWGYKDSLGIWWIYDEYYTTDQSLTWEEHATRIHAKDGWQLVRDGDRGDGGGERSTGRRVSYRLEPLPDVPQRWDYSEPHYFRNFYGPLDRPDMFREFAQYQMPVTPAKMAVDSGIETVRGLLKVQEATGEPRLFIDATACPKLARQIRTYRWERSSGIGVNPKDARPRPLKKDDHAPDALRYLLHSDHIDSMAAPEGRSIPRASRRSVRLNRRPIRGLQR